MRNLFLKVLFIFLVLATACDQELPDITAPEITEKLPVFEKVEAEQSGITFANLVKEDIATHENIFDFDYFYNGAGVGVADLNNDGYEDLIFTGNQQANRLYENKGELKFEDKTRGSGINQGKGWASGVTFVDINQDGWLDIYICQGGLRSEEQRKNRLLINQKDMTFTEEAAAYGLADASISTQAVFFDYDKDGDLDALVMNENPFFGYEPHKFQEILKEKKEYLHQSSCHFYENINGMFRDISFKAGLLRPAFGLGLVVNDFNEDGWLDIYMTNDYYLPDVLYINDTKGGFVDETKKRMDQISFFGMGVDVADINNDELEDIFVLDMAMADHYKAKTRMASMDTKQFDLLVNEYNYQPQYMYNSLQLKGGNQLYRNISQLTDLSKTDWSWAVLMADFNHDEQKDIFVSNGYKKFAIDNDIRVGVRLAKNVFKGNVPLDVKKRLHDRMPSEKVENVIFKNNGKLEFTKTTKEWGLNHQSFSNGSAYADLDNDGDLELIVNNIDDPAFLYKNLSVEQKRGNYLNVVSEPLKENFAKVSISYDGKKQVYRNGRVRGYLSAVQNMAHFGLGNIKKIDTLKVEWPSGKIAKLYNVRANQKVALKESDFLLEKDQNNEESQKIFEPLDLAAIGVNFQHKENEYDDFEQESLLPYKQSTLGPFITAGDLNGDGQDDLIVGGASGQATRLFLKVKDKFIPKDSKVFELDKAHEDMESVLFDYDQDGDQDLYIVSGGNGSEPKSPIYKDRLYLNDGNGAFSKSNIPLLDGAYSGKSVTSLDFDKDGRQDLVIGNRIIPHQYPKHVPSVLYRNTSAGLVDVTEKLIPALRNFGIVNKVISTDFNADGWPDLMVVGEWTSIGLFKNDQGKFVDVSTEYGLAEEKGWWFTVAETDVNNDGLPDYVLGNIGLNSKYKTDKEKPLKVFAKDFDENGSWDLVLSQKYKGSYVPFRGRQCSSEQMPFIAKKFETFESFAKASLVDVYGDELDNAYQREVNNFHSLVLINQEGASFQKTKLPIEAQLAPVLSCQSIDINQDGFQDLILGGNIYNTEVETPRLDAGIGTVLISNQENDYEILNYQETGLVINGNVKSIKIVETSEGKILIAGKNNDYLSGFKLR